MWDVLRKVLAIYLILLVFGLMFNYGSHINDDDDDDFDDYFQ